MTFYVQMHICEEKTTYQPEVHVNNIIIVVFKEFNQRHPRRIIMLF